MLSPEQRAALDEVCAPAPNRNTFEEPLLATSSANVARRANGVAVLFVDVDDSKHTNETLGHAAGDELRVEIADRKATRPGASVPRLGGDEFAVVIEGPTTPARAAAITPSAG